MRAFATAAAGLALLGLIAATAAGYLGALAWPLELFAHFRPQLAAAGLAIIPLALVLRRPRLAVVSLLLAAANVAPLSDHLGAHFGLRAQAMAMPGDTRASDSTAGAAAAGRPLRVMTYNMLGVNTDEAAFRALLRAERPDVLVLTELPGRDGLLQRMTGFEDIYPYRLIGRRESPHEVAVLSRWPIAAVETNRDADMALPVVSVDLCPPASSTAKSAADAPVVGPCVRVVAVHGLVPFGSGAARRNAQLDIAARFAATAPGGLAVLAGDLNLTPWAPSFARLLERGGLQDTSPLRGLTATWHTRNPFAIAAAPIMGLSIDHVLVSPQIQARAVRVAEPIGSDHRPVIADLMLPPS